MNKLYFESSILDDKNMKNNNQSLSGIRVKNKGRLVFSNLNNNPISRKLYQLKLMVQVK